MDILLFLESVIMDDVTTAKYFVVVMLLLFRESTTKYEVPRDNCDRFIYMSRDMREIKRRIEGDTAEKKKKERKT